MPDFMEGLSKGIEKSKNLVIDSIKGLSGDMKVGMNLDPAFVTGTSSSKTENSGQGNTTINFNGNYSFNDKNDIDYFMNQAAVLTKRKRG
ncbi:hypothetical protein D3C76_1736110 [compost metagenome]